jgi:hypothetical protein
MKVYYSTCLFLLAQHTGLITTRPSPFSSIQSVNSEKTSSNIFLLFGRRKLGKQQRNHMHAVYQLPDSTLFISTKSRLMRKFVSVRSLDGIWQLYAVHVRVTLEVHLSFVINVRKCTFTDKKKTKKI